MKPFVPCQPAYYQNPDKPQWLKGQIQSRTGDRTYTVTGADSAVYTRNRVNLRERHTTDMPEPTNTPYCLQLTGLQNRDESEPDSNINVQTEPTVETRKMPERSHTKPSWMKDYVLQIFNSG